MSSNMSIAQEVKKELKLQKVRKQLETQIEKMASVLRHKRWASERRKYETDDDDDEYVPDDYEYINAEDYLVAYRKSLNHYHNAKESINQDINRKKWEKYNYACDYLSKQMEATRLWYDRALCEMKTIGSIVR